MKLKKKLKQLLTPKKDPTTFFSGFEEDGVVVMVYTPTNDTEKNVWFVRFHDEQDQSLLLEKRFKRMKGLPRLVADKGVLQELQDSIDAELQKIQSKKEKRSNEGKEE